MFFFFKQKTAYEMRISDSSSDVCSSDLAEAQFQSQGRGGEEAAALDADQQVGLKRPDRLGQTTHRLAPGGRMCQESGDVVEQDPRLREVWNVADVGFEVHEGLS